MRTLDFENKTEYKGGIFNFRRNIVKITKTTIEMANGNKFNYTIGKGEK